MNISKQADKVSSRSYVSLQHYRWQSFAYFTFNIMVIKEAREQAKN